MRPDLPWQDMGDCEAAQTPGGWLVRDRRSGSLAFVPDPCWAWRRGGTGGEHWQSPEWVAWWYRRLSGPMAGFWRWRYTGRWYGSRLSRWLWRLLFRGDSARCI